MFSFFANLRVEDAARGVDDSPQDLPVAGTPAGDEESHPLCPLKQFLLDDPAYRELSDAKKEGWDLGKQGDEWFSHHKERSAKANDKVQEKMFMMMIDIGHRMDRLTKAFTLPRHCSELPVRGHGGPPLGFSAPDPPCHAALDLCMAPGGFTKCLLDRNKAYGGSFVVDAMSLPVERGGHIQRVAADARLTVAMADINQFMPAELGIGRADMPDGFAMPEQPRPWPFSPRLYDIVVCDGKVQSDPSEACGGGGGGTPVRLHKASRLRCAQVTLGLSRLRPGGTLVLLRFASHTRKGFTELYYLRRMSRRLYLYKDQKCHTKMSAFYAVAVGVRSDGDVAREMVRRAGEAWKQASLTEVADEDVERVGKGQEDLAESEEEKQRMAEAHEKLAAMIDEFGDEFRDLARPLWKTQARALREWIGSMKPRKEE